MGAEAPILSGVLVVALVKLQAAHRGWAWWRLVQGPRSLGAQVGMRFCRLMGSGAEGGFGLRPSTTHQGIVALFENAAQAEVFCAGPTLQAYRERSEHSWVGQLSITSARGGWGGRPWVATSDTQLGRSATRGVNTDTTGPMTPLAALTRASIRPARALRFWRHAPAAQAQMAQARGCLLAVGLGEAPLLRQCTFSLWTDAQAMRAYAGQGAHRQAVEQVHAHDLFSESLFLRMHLLAQSGHWPAAWAAESSRSAPGLPGAQGATRGSGR